MNPAVKAANRLFEMKKRNHENQKEKILDSNLACCFPAMFI
jgi:hypothetical protein